MADNKSSPRYDWRSIADRVNSSGRFTFVPRILVGGRPLASFCASADGNEWRAFFDRDASDNLTSSIHLLGDEAQVQADLASLRRTLTGGETSDADTQKLLATIDELTSQLEARNVAAGQSLADLADAAIDAAAEGDTIPPVHPGEILLEEFIRPAGLSPIRAARLLGVPRTRIERLVTGETAMTVDTALRLEALFGASAEFWMDIQTRHDLALARQTNDPAIANIKRWSEPQDVGGAYEKR